MTTRPARRAETFMQGKFTMKPMMSNGLCGAMGTERGRRGVLIAMTLLTLLAGLNPVWAADPIKAVVTVPELGNLVSEIGGDRVTVTALVKGSEDPHYVEARPSFVKELSTAELFMRIGLELEDGWVPVLLKNARNAAVSPGGAGHLDGSTVIKAMDIPQGPVDRAQGDVHQSGNPHYLMDPINGLKVARLIRDKLIALRPADRAYFEGRHDDFRARLGRAWIGAKLAQAYDVEKLALLQDVGKLDEFLKSQNQLDQIGGWVGRMKELRGRKVIADHNMYVYFSHRFGLEVVGFLEPKPGIPPTSRHLAEVIQTVKEKSIGMVLTSSYFNARHSAFVSGRTGIKVVEMAHQVGSRKGADDYIGMIEYNIARLTEAAGGQGK